MTPAHDHTETSAEKWGVFLALGWDFDLRAWDARVASLPVDSGARKTALRHRDGLLRALESRDYGAVEDKIELMVRTTTMAMHQRNVQAGVALNKARSTPRKKDVQDWITRQLQREPTLKCPDLWSRAPSRVTDQISYDRFQKRVTAVRKEQRIGR